MEIIARGQITIWNYKDGDDAYSVILNHDTHAVACDPSGNALGGELGPSGKAVFALSAYKGATKLTMRYSSAASTAGMCAWKFGTISGCTAVQVSGSNEKFYINTMIADSAYVEIVCSVDGKASITKRVTVVKQKKGDTGDPGKPGDDGKQGCMLRPRGTWTAQTQYVYNDQYRDVVIHNNSVYIVKTTHTSTVSFDSSKWEPFNEFINVATSVLLANKGYIDVLGAARLFVGDTNKSTGWEMTNGYIKHTKSGLTLTADGKLYDPDGLHLSVGGKTVQAIVDGAVDGIQVGGRNYIQNSTFMYDFDKWVKFNYNGNYSISSQNGQYSLLISRLGYAGSKRHGISQTISTNLKPGEYTLSLKYRSDQFDGTRNQIFVRIYSTASVYADKGIITIPNTQGGDSDGQITFNVDSNVYKAELYVVLDKNGYLRVWDIKLEQGNKATDWSPAPEDLTTKIEENSSKIEQLPDQISLTVKKDISSGGLNYITNSTKILETVGKGIANQAVGVGWKINKSISGKKYGGAFKVKFEGCSFSSNSTIYLQVGNSGGWNYQGITGYNKVSENGEYVFFRNTNTAPETTDDGGVYIRIDYISGGKITVSEVRAYDVPDSGLTEPLPWYPSKWENESIYSEIKQTADSISLKVAGWQGGTNLLPRSKFSESVKGWNVNGSPTYGITTAKNAKCLYLSGSVDGAGIWQKGYMPIQYKVKGYQFAVSFDVHNPSKVETLRIGLEGSSPSDLSVNIKDKGNDGWTRVAKTVTYDNVSNDSFVIYTDKKDCPTIYIKNVKIEFGPYATNFTENEKDVLLSTGIDIFDRKLVLTADNTLIQSNDGKQIAMFTMKDGKPLLRAENIDTGNLTVNHLKTYDKKADNILEISGEKATFRIESKSSLNEELVSSLDINSTTENFASGENTSGIKVYPNIHQKGFSSIGYDQYIRESNLNPDELSFHYYHQVHSKDELCDMAIYSTKGFGIGHKDFYNQYDNSFTFTLGGAKIRESRKTYRGETEAVEINGVKLFFKGGIYVGKGQDWSDVEHEYPSDTLF